MGTFFNPGTGVTADIGTSLQIGQSADDLVNQVSSQLAGHGITVSSFSAKTPGAVTDFLGKLGLAQKTVVYRLEIYLYSAWDSQILLEFLRDTFYTTNGFYPSQYSIVSYREPGTSKEIPTGQQAAGEPGGEKSTEKSVTDAIQEFFKGLTGTIKTVVIVIAIVLVLLVGLIAFGPSTGKIAQALT